MLIKYYRKMSDMDKDDPLKHSKWGALLWMVLDKGLVLVTPFSIINNIALMMCHIEVK